MARRLKSDKLLFLAAFLLVCASIVMVFSASVVMAEAWYSQPNLFLVKQVTWALFGLLLLAVLMRVDYHHFRQPAVIWTTFGIVVVALVAVLFGPEIKGTRRWFGIGGIGVQPSELAKLAAILFTAGLLDRRMDRINDIAYALVPIAVGVGVLAGLILVQPDFGTAMSLLIVAGVMVFAAGLSYRYLIAGAVLGLPVVALVLLGEEYRRRRLLAFLDPWADPRNGGFQIVQSLIAVGTGGLFGRGLMEGMQKRFFLPEPHTDFIYAVVAEELGFVGAVAILAAFAVIAGRGLRAAVNAPDRFGSFLAIGLTTMVVVQALVNISVVLGLLPTKGIPLPFVSAGGSSLLVNLMGMGILLNISQHASSRE